jgi:hypothetical protein
MSHVITANFTPLTTARSTDSIWALTRAMKKAGWEVIASSGGTSRGTNAGVYNTGAYYVLSGSFTNISFASKPDTQRVTVTGLSGMAVKHTGDFLEVSGANTSANNGRFIITEVLSATSVNILTGTAGVAPDINNGAGLNAIHRRRTAYSAEDLWQVGASITSGAAGALAAGVAPERMILTGLAGISATDVGNWLVTSAASTAANNGTWLIVRYISSSSVEVLAPGSVGPYTGTISWTLRQGTGANMGSGSNAYITTKPNAGDEDFIVTGVGAVLPGATGGGAIGIAPTYNTVEVNNLSGMTIADVGKWMTITGAANAGNNGEFLIVGYISATSMRILNPNRVASDANPVSWAIRTGPEEGNFLCLSGALSVFNNGPYQITKTLGPDSCWVRIPRGSASDGNNGSISWVQKDPTLESLSNIVQWGQGCWITLRGPSMMKMPFTGGISAASNFLVGEKVTQVSTGAEGELVGVTVDSAGTGWLVVSPQVKGTGTEYDFGWDLTAIVGVSSTAQVTPTGIQEFQKEVQFATANDANWTKGGYCFVSMTRKDTEQRHQLWVRSRNSLCTALLSPGFSSATDTDGNTFPTQAFVIVGAVAGAQDNWSRHAYDPATNALGKSQISCANALRRQNQSADGTFTLLQYNTNVNHAGGFSYQRMDNQEEGDVDPWWFYAHNTANMWNTSRTGSAGTTAFNVFTTYGALSQTNTASRGGLMTRARGVGYKELQGAAGNGSVLMFQVTDGGLTASTGGYCATWYQGSSDPQYVASSATNDKRILEKITVMGLVASNKFIKGTCRWLYHATQAGSNILDTYGNKQWVVGAPGALTYFSQPLVFGPWDGKSTPTA